MHIFWTSWATIWILPRFPQLILWEHYRFIVLLLYYIISYYIILLHIWAVIVVKGMSIKGYNCYKASMQTTNPHPSPNSTPKHCNKILPNPKPQLSPTPLQLHLNQRARTWDLTNPPLYLYIHRKYILYSLFPDVTFFCNTL